jgi:glycosyltransferase involved in cell wall biosynthesis
MIAPKPMRIIIVGGTPPPTHGTSIYILALLKALRSQQHFSLEHVETSELRDDFENMGRFDWGNISNGLRSWGRLMRLCIVQRPDVVYVPIAQNTGAFLRDGFFVLFAKLFGAKTVVHLHGSYFREFAMRSPKAVQWFIALVMHATDLALVLGGNLRSNFAPWLPDRRIAVLENFIDPDVVATLDALHKKHLRTSAGRIVVSYLGTLIESKGILQLLEAVEPLVREGRVDLRIAGKPARDRFTGMDGPEIEGRIQELMQKYPDNVFYNGPIYGKDEKCRFLLETDIFAFPTWYPYEGQPLVILEAMAARCALVSTRSCGAIEATVAEGINGLLVTKQDVGELRDALLKLSENEEIISRFQNNSRELFEKKYTQDAHVSKMHQLVVDLIDIRSKHLMKEP